MTGDMATPASATARCGRPRGLAISWYFAPNLGSADVDFFRRIKDLDADFDVLAVRRPQRDERLLDLPHRAGLERHEFPLGHWPTRSREARDGYLRSCLDFFEAHRGSFDFLVSHSNEVHCHRVAREIQRRSSLPWIAYFGDPSERNPYVRHLRDYPFHAEDNEAERTAFACADRLVFNNEYQRRLMLRGMERYLGKSSVVLHAYDRDAYPATPMPREDGRFHVGHFGTLYPVKRRGDLVFRAVDRLLEIYPRHADRLVLEFWGTLSADDAEAHRAMRFRDNVLLRGQVGYLESLARMTQMDALLLVDAFFDPKEDDLDFNPFLPCKFTDYLGARKPIVGVTMRSGLPGEVLAASGNPLADERVDRIAYVLKRAADGRIAPDFSVYERFDHAHQVEGMRAVVDDILGARRRAA